MSDGAGNRGGGWLGNTQDLVCGLFFIIIGLGGMWVGRNYPMGSPVRLGTGVFPYILCWGLVGSGAIILFNAIFTKGQSMGHIAWRPVILISIAATAFALAIDPLGLVVAMILLIIPAGLAGHEFYPKEYVIFSILLVVLGTALFIFGLGMPIKVFPWS